MTTSDRMSFYNPDNVIDRRALIDAKLASLCETDRANIERHVEALIQIIPKFGRVSALELLFLVGTRMNECACADGGGA